VFGAVKRRLLKLPLLRHPVKGGVALLNARTSRGTARGASKMIFCVLDCGRQCVGVRPQKDHREAARQSVISTYEWFRTEFAADLPLEDEGFKLLVPP
jgi:hypothetical protein